MKRTNATHLTFGQLSMIPVIIAAFGVLAVSISGCGNVIRRGQSPDDPLVKYSDQDQKTKFVGHICGVKGLRPAQIEGIGLVVGLEGTGSEPAPSGQKDYLLRELKSKKTTENAKAALSSKNTSMVMIRGLIPPAAKKGDLIDLEIILHPKSDTTSLKHGELLASDLRPMAFLGRSVKLGNSMGKAKGGVLVDSLFTTEINEDQLKRGRILGGGKVAQDAKLSLVVHADETSVKVTRSIAHSINDRYSTYSDAGRGDSANPVTDRIVELRLPNEYQHNLGRFIQALQAMAFDEGSADREDRLRSLKERIGVPATCQRAAIELEAIGEDGIPALKQALKHPDFEVRFHAAEALAYLGETEGISTLEQAAAEEPAFRWHGLTALASIDHKLANQALENLLHAESPEARYGAFRALRACCPTNHKIVGQRLANDFHLHQINSQGPGVLHFSQTKRPEIVVFGSSGRVADDFIFVEPGLTAKAIDQDRVRIIRFDPYDGELRLTCSSKVSELIRTLAKLGVGYTTLLELFQEADEAGSLDSDLVINAAPRIGSKSLNESVGDRGSAERSERYIAEPAPNLFSDVVSEQED